jgi:hypothetical protein
MNQNGRFSNRAGDVARSAAQHAARRGYSLGRRNSKVIMENEMLRMDISAPAGVMQTAAPENAIFAGIIAGRVVDSGREKAAVDIIVNKGGYHRE